MTRKAGGSLEPPALEKKGTGMRKRVTYRPSKAQGIFGAIWGGVFVLIGLFVAIPAFGAFGMLWTVGALAITGMNIYHTFGSKYVGPEICVEEEESDVRETSCTAAEAASHHGEPSAARTVKDRLEQLETLKKAGLITEEEFREKREEILKEL